MATPNASMTAPSVMKIGTEAFRRSHQLATHSSRSGKRRALIRASQRPSKLDKNSPAPPLASTTPRSSRDTHGFVPRTASRSDGKTTVSSSQRATTALRPSGSMPTAPTSSPPPRTSSTSGRPIPRGPNSLGDSAQTIAINDSCPRAFELVRRIAHRTAPPNDRRPSPAGAPNGTSASVSDTVRVAADPRRPIPALCGRSETGCHLAAHLVS